MKHFVRALIATSICFIILVTFWPEEFREAENGMYEILLYENRDGMWTATVRHDTTRRLTEPALKTGPAPLQRQVALNRANDIITEWKREHEDDN